MQKGMDKTAKELRNGTELTWTVVQNIAPGEVGDYVTDEVHHLP